MIAGEKLTAKKTAKSAIIHCLSTFSNADAVISGLVGDAGVTGFDSMLR